jgi:hypothetical protein
MDWGHSVPLIRRQNRRMLLAMLSFEHLQIAVAAASQRFDLLQTKYPVLKAKLLGYSRIEEAGPEISCACGNGVYFESVKATLTQLRRDTAKVVRPVIHGGENLALTGHGRHCPENVLLRKIDRRAACRDLIAIGPVEFLPRK